MQTFPKKRIEIIIESPMLRRLERVFEREEIRGYTVLPALSGLGVDGLWQRDGLISEAGSMVAVVVILDESRAESFLEHVFPLVSSHMGIVNVSDCAVLRSDRF